MDNSGRNTLKYILSNAKKIIVLHLLYCGYRLSSPVVKQPGPSVNHPPPFSAEVKERVVLPLWAFMACSRLKFTFTFILRLLYQWYTNSKSSFQFSEKHTHPVHSVFLHVNKVRLLLQFYYQYPPTPPPQFISSVIHTSRYRFTGLDIHQFIDESIH